MIADSKRGRSQHYQARHTIRNCSRGELISGESDQTNCSGVETGEEAVDNWWERVWEGANTCTKSGHASGCGDAAMSDTDKHLRPEKKSYQAREGPIASDSNGEGKLS
jgi:hypothetical protein